MKPIQLAGHERPITKIRINRDGDLLWTTGKDGYAMCWYLDSGMRLGTYEGHNGALNDIAVDFNTRNCLTAGSDCRFGVWEATTGELIRLVEPKAPDRVTSVAWACGDKKFLACTIGRSRAYTLVYDFDEEYFRSDAPSEDIVNSAISIPPLAGDGESFLGHTAKITEALWGSCNDFIITASEDGRIIKWNVETQVADITIQFNPKAISTVNSMEYNWDKTLIVATGADATARIFEAETLSPLKIFASDKPLNCASFHPTLDLLLVGGGQQARDVTTTKHNKGKFEIEFFHTVFETKVGEIRTGHFSPINCVAVSSDGSHFVTAAEEGNSRIFKFNPGFASKFKSIEKTFTEAPINKN